MNEKEAQNEQLENILRKAHLPEPSSELKKRISAEATKAWNQIPTELPWLIPLRRLAASAAAAIVIIWLANYYSEHTLAQWHPVNFTDASRHPSGHEALPEMPYGPLMKRLAVLNRRPAMLDTSALNDHVEKLRQFLNEQQQNGISRPSVPSGDKSYLIPNQTSFNSYS